MLATTGGGWPTRLQYVPVLELLEVSQVGLERIVVSQVGHEQLVPYHMFALLVVCGMACGACGFVLGLVGTLLKMSLVGLRRI